MSEPSNLDERHPDPVSLFTEKGRAKARRSGLLLEPEGQDPISNAVMTLAKKLDAWLAPVPITNCAELGIAGLGRRLRKLWFERSFPVFLCKAVLQLFAELVLVPLVFLYVLLEDLYLRLKLFYKGLLIRKKEVTIRKLTLKLAALTETVEKREKLSQPFKHKKSSGA